jgi:hypothetical protein
MSFYVDLKMPDLSGLSTGLGTYFLKTVFTNEAPEDRRTHILGDYVDGWTMQALATLPSNQLRKFIMN